MLIQLKSLSLVLVVIGSIHIHAYLQRFSR